MSQTGNPPPDGWEERISREAKRLKRRQPSEGVWDRIETRLRTAMEECRVAAAEQASPIRQGKMPKRIFRPPAGLWNRPWKRMALGLASAALVVSTAWMLRERIPIPWLQPPDILTRIERDVAKAERRYQALIERLAPLVRETENRVDPSLLALYQEKLVLLDESIRECQAALAVNRGNPAVQLALLSSYRDKLKTLYAVMQMES